MQTDTESPKPEEPADDFEHPVAEAEADIEAMRQARSGNPQTEMVTRVAAAAHQDLLSRIYGTVRRVP